jgi:putative transposase
MSEKGYSEEQIITALQQAENGDKVAEVCRKLSISQATFYSWKKQYAGLGITELR